MQQTNSYDERIIKINTFCQGNEIPITCFFLLKRSLISQTVKSPPSKCVETNFQLLYFHELKPDSQRTHVHFIFAGGQVSWDPRQY